MCWLPTAQRAVTADVGPTAVSTIALKTKSKCFLVPREEVAVLVLPAPPGMLLEEKPVGVFRSQLLCFITFSFLEPLQIFEQLVDGRDGCLLLSPSGENKGDNSSLGTMKVGDAFCSVAV